MTRDHAPNIGVTNIYSYQTHNITIINNSSGMITNNHTNYADSYIYLLISLKHLKHTTVT